MNLGEARHRQSLDAEFFQSQMPLLDDKEWKHHKRKSDGLLEGLTLSNKQLAAAFAFGFAMFLMILSTSVADRKNVFESTLLRIKPIHAEASPSNLKLIPSTDNKVLEWLQASSKVNQLKAENHGVLRIGIVDFIKPNVLEWKSLAGGWKPAVFSSRTGDKTLTWSDAFPEYIHRDEEVQNSKCSEMIFPDVPEKLELDMVVVNIPCSDSTSYYNSSSRDIGVLQAALSAAHIASRTGSEYMHVVVVTKCRLHPSIFKCKYLLQHEDDIWLYKLDLNSMRALLRLPVGSCKAVQASHLSGDELSNSSRQAYATILHSVESYVCGAMILAHTIRRSGSTRDLILLVDDHIGAEEKLGLEAAGWKVQQIERIRNPKATPLAYNEWNYSKFRLWQLTEYEKIVFIDADVLVENNMDFLFRFPELSAARNHGSVFNSGVMVIEPSECTFEYLVRNIGEVESYNGGDQGYLNEVFTLWHRLPRSVNFLKHFDDDLEENEYKVSKLTAEPAALHGIHFLGIKPWVCGRKVDCNKQMEFSNDAVVRKWWRVHDTMPQKLQRFCRNGSKKARS